MSSQLAVESTSTRGAFLQSPGPPSAGNQDLLAQIQKGAMLRKVETNAHRHSVISGSPRSRPAAGGETARRRTAEPGQNHAESLAAALAQRRQKMNASTDSEDEW